MTAPNAELLRSLGQLARGLSALFWGLPAIGSSLQLFVFGFSGPHRHEADQPGFADKHNARSLPYGWIASLFTCFHF